MQYIKIRLIITKKGDTNKNEYKTKTFTGKRFSR